MSLIAGDRIGPYEIVAPLGAGGMGEVYRARDTKLNRDVAIKVLLPAVANDPDRLARFSREAQVLASLNHPNIAHIYGIEDADGVKALVLELVEGEDLAQRIARGPIPLDEALPIARQIAEALEAAHEQGIIHRDLKPANIALSGRDQVKVLDFGLAKLSAPPVGGASSSVSMSPTLTTPAMMTGVGMILGTAAYMAPEQAKGREADKRCDLWAFGCVVYEMLTAKRAFEGEDITDTIAAVMRGEPDWSALPAETPASLRLLLESCLTKDRTQRAADIAVVQFLLDGRATLPSTVAMPSAAATTPVWKRVLPWAVAGAFGVAMIAGLLIWSPWHRVAASRVIRTTIATAAPATLTAGVLDGNLALSPDGTRVVYVGNHTTQLFVRALDALEPLAIASGALRGPFVSPDSQWAGFFESSNTLRKVALSGGPAITLTNIDGAPRGATWGPGDAIVFATGNPVTGLQRVSAAGGTVEVLTRPERARGEADHLWPEFLPGGRAVLFTITSESGGLDAAQVAVRDLRTGEQKILVRGGSHALYLPSGHLVYVAAGTLRAIPFDLTRLETYGTAVPVLTRVATTSTGTGELAVATDGTLVYVDNPGGSAANARTLVWVDRRGTEEPVAAPPRLYQQPRLSPDGTRVALSAADQESDLWIWDLRRLTLTRVTLDPRLDSFPVWMPNGDRLLFGSTRGGGQLNVWWQAADGTGVAERLTTSTNSQAVTSVSPDGRVAVYQETTPTTSIDLMQLALDGSRRVTPLLQTKFAEQNAAVSPDGRWLAYDSNSAGSYDVYVRPFPNVSAGQWQVSAGGGMKPRWARNGKELFYVAPDGALLRVPVEATGAAWNAGAPTKLLEGRYFIGGSNNGAQYDISPDGQRFLMIKSTGSEAGVVSAIVVVQHWDEELKRLVPTK